MDKGAEQSLRLEDKTVFLSDLVQTMGNAQVIIKTESINRTFQFPSAENIQARGARVAEALLRGEQKDLDMATKCQRAAQKIGGLVAEAHQALDRVKTIAIAITVGAEGVKQRDLFEWIKNTEGSFEEAQHEWERLDPRVREILKGSVQMR